MSGINPGGGRFIVEQSASAPPTIEPSLSASTLELVASSTPPDLAYECLTTRLTSYLHLDHAYGLMNNMARRHPEFVKIVDRGLSPEGRQLREIVVDIPGPGPKRIEAINSDPHPWDERIPLLGEMRRLAWMLLDPETHKGMRRHVLLSSPDALANLSRLERRYGNLGFGLRDFNIRQQSGWTMGDASNSGDSSHSAGWRACTTMLDEIDREVLASNGRLRFDVFRSGHGFRFARGTHFNWAETQNDFETLARSLEKHAIDSGEPMSIKDFDFDIRTIIKGTNYSALVPSAAEIRKLPYEAYVECSDLEYATKMKSAPYSMCFEIAEELVQVKTGIGPLEAAFHGKEITRLMSAFTELRASVKERFPEGIVVKSRLSQVVPAPFYPDSDRAFGNHTWKPPSQWDDQALENGAMAILFSSRYLHTLHTYLEPTAYLGNGPIAIDRELLLVESSELLRAMHDLTSAVVIRTPRTVDDLVHAYTNFSDEVSRGSLQRSVDEELSQSSERAL